MPRPKRQGKKRAVADARAGNWVDRFVPAPLAPYLRLARADRPIGFFLLALPCFWSVALAGRSIGAPYPDPWLLLLFAIGAIVMRAAGCTYNDIVDRDIDAKVARTRSRPLPSKQVTVEQATIFMGLLSLTGLAVLLSFNRFTVLLGLAVLPIVALYPFVKRVSSWPQAVLGLAFNWGALLGWTAVLAQLDWPAVILYAGAVAWTIGYDTIYAHQDREDDALIGMKSTALKFGRTTKAWLALFYGFAWVAITGAGIMAGAGFFFLLGMVLAASHLTWQVLSLDIDNAENCLVRFRANRDFGLIVFAAIVLDMALAALI
ncbi:MAG: 4-hydroxybenzoate octaprenyltransferase [Alphaproteobacteria bacterium]|nr:4-hydroxybenzoate octaprenyltransferase [Alphaproteobacteria bacterium]